MTSKITNAAKELGRKGGRSKSPAKVAAARAGLVKAREARKAKRLARLTSASA
jgi:hypothetical protein